MQNRMLAPLVIRAIRYDFTHTTNCPQFAHPVNNFRVTQLVKLTSDGWHARNIPCTLKGQVTDPLPTTDQAHRRTGGAEDASSTYSVDHLFSALVSSWLSTSEMSA